jgi:hypothetical protein
MSFWSDLVNDVAKFGACFAAGALCDLRYAPGDERPDGL